MKTKKILLVFIVTLVLLFNFVLTNDNIIVKADFQYYGLQDVTIYGTDGATVISDNIGTGEDIYLFSVAEKIFIAYHYEENNLLTTQWPDFYLSVYSENTRFTHIVFEDTANGIYMKYNMFDTTIYFDYVGLGEWLIINMGDDIGIDVVNDPKIYLIDNDYQLNTYAYGYATGYDDGMDDMFADGSDYYGYNELNAYDYGVGRAQGRTDVFNNGSTAYGFTVANSYDYGIGYDIGQTDLFNNGSDSYGFTLEDSDDYDSGYTAGASHNVNSGLVEFTTSFDTWIVPAILLVLLLGGFISIYAKRQKGSD